MEGFPRPLASPHRKERKGNGRDEELKKSNVDWSIWLLVKSRRASLSFAVTAGVAGHSLMKGAIRITFVLLT